MGAVWSGQRPVKLTVMKYPPSARHKGWRRLRLLASAPEKWSYAAGLRPTRDLPLPHFLGIGVAKAGTTWLDRNLRAHPLLRLPRRKELHYFDREFHRSLRFYARYWAPPDGRLRGEITPGYSILPPGRIRFIRAVMPEVRLVLLLRNPIERSWSHVLMKYVTRGPRRFEEVSEEEWIRLLDRPGMRARSDYLTILDRWAAVFPPEQLYVGVFEDIAERPRDLLREIFAHLGVSEPPQWESIPYRQVIHRGSGHQMPPKVRRFLEARYAAQIEALAQRLGPRVERWLVGRPKRRPASGASVSPAWTETTR